MGQVTILRGSPPDWAAGYNCGYGDGYGGSGYGYGSGDGS